MKNIENKLKMFKSRKQLANAITAVVFRNSMVEDLHARLEGFDNELMRLLVMDVSRRLDAVLRLNEELESEQFEEALVFLANFCSGWESWDCEQECEDIPVTALVGVLQQKGSFMTPKIRKKLSAGIEEEEGLSDSH